jgi:predicted dehydrogenase
LDGAPPTGVALHGAAYIQPEVEDVAFAVLSWNSGVKAHIHVSWLDPAKVRRFTVIGSRKMIVYNDVIDEKIAVFDKGVDRVPKLGERMDFDHYDRWSLRHRMGDLLIPSLPAEEPLRAEAGHFLDCIRTGAVPLTGPRHARDVVAVLEAGQMSLQNGGRVCAPSLPSVVF